MFNENQSKCAIELGKNKIKNRASNKARADNKISDLKYIKNNYILNIQKKSNSQTSIYYIICDTKFY